MDQLAVAVFRQQLKCYENGRHLQKIMKITLAVAFYFWCGGRVGWIFIRLFTILPRELMNSR